MFAGSGSAPSLCRRDVLRWTAAVPLLAAVGKTRMAHAATDSGIRGQQGKQVTLKLGSSQPTHTQNAHTVFFDTFLSELVSRTDGNVGVIFYGDSQLGPENKYPNQINSGTLDMMMVPSVWSTIWPEIGVLTMGFLFDSLDQTGKVMDGQAGTLLQESFKQKTEAEILGWCYNFGGRNVLTKTAVTTPVPMSFNEIYTSLETGVIEGLEHDPPTILQFKFYELCKSLTMTQHIFDPCSPIIADATLQGLSPAYQQALRQAAIEGVKHQRTEATGAAQQALDTLKQNGVKTIEIDRAKLTAEVKPLWQSFTDQHPDTKPVLQAILTETGKAA